VEKNFNSLEEEMWSIDGDSGSVFLDHKDVNSRVDDDAEGARARPFSPVARAVNLNVV
jgi:hypothetical protein